MKSAAHPVDPRAMTRCECADVAFEDVAADLERRALAPEDVMQRTGCGQLCTACLPDLRSFLQKRGNPAVGASPARPPAQSSRSGEAHPIA